MNIMKNVINIFILILLIMTSQNVAGQIQFTTNDIVEDGINESINDTVIVDVLPFLQIKNNEEDIDDNEQVVAEDSDNTLIEETEEEMEIPNSENRQSPGLDITSVIAVIVICIVYLLRIR